MTPLDRKSGDRSLIYLPDKGGRIYFSSYGKDGATGRDIYPTVPCCRKARFDEPMKLAGYINTDQDEDFAFLRSGRQDLLFLPARATTAWAATTCSEHL